MFLKSIDEIRNIRWSRSYLWDLCFPTAPEPFNRWFPAFDVDDLVLSIGAWESPGFLGRIPIPKDAPDVKRVRISFVDDVFTTLESWLTKWVNVEILNNGAGVTPVEEAVKPMHLHRLDETKKVIRATSYLLFPYSEMPYNGRSTSIANEYSIEFLVWDFWENDMTPGGILRDYKKRTPPVSTPDSSLQYV